MTADPIFFRDLAYVFVAALIGGGLAWLTRQPLVLGYEAARELVADGLLGGLAERVR